MKLLYFLILAASCCISCTKKYYSYYDFNSTGSTYCLYPTHLGSLSGPDTALVYMHFYQLTESGNVTISEGLKLTIDQDVLYLDTSGIYPVKLLKGFHQFKVETSWPRYGVKTKKFFFGGGANYSLAFYLIDAYNDPKIKDRKPNPNYKQKKSGIRS